VGKKKIKLADTVERLNQTEAQEGGKKKTAEGKKRQGA